MLHSSYYAGLFKEPLSYCRSAEASVVVRQSHEDWPGFGGAENCLLSSPKCLGLPSQMRGSAFQRSPPSGELDTLEEEEAGQTWYTQAHSKGLLGPSGGVLGQGLLMQLTGTMRPSVLWPGW
ncbi:hypothetical protein XENOCAPTIV_017938 [Xenoophorus captivus]|uniref:Uncharacterized protein n=1 Tax=Xenoophorus captivus TaxID=1517983 RepID=A0ABV0RR42_9TELE